MILDDVPWLWQRQGRSGDGKVTILWECTECGHEFETHYQKHERRDA